MIASLIITVLFLFLAAATLAGFGLVVLFGAPYLPTMQAQQKQALKLLDLKPGQKLYDLGCGDGRVLRTAASQGLICVGYELNPILALIARVVNIKYRRQVKIINGSYWHADLSDADGVFVFLITRFMSRFDRLIKARKGNKPLKVVSHAFEIPGQKPARKLGALFLYIYK